MGTAAARAAYGHVVHAFDGAFNGREVLAGLKASDKIVNASATGSVVSLLREAGLDNFAVTGEASPKKLLVLPNTGSAAAARAVYAALPAEQKASVGVLAVRSRRFDACFTGLLGATMAFLAFSVDSLGS